MGFFSECLKCFFFLARDLSWSWENKQDLWHHLLGSFEIWNGHFAWKKWDTLFLFPEPEEVIPEQYRVLIYRCNDIYVLAYIFCDQGLFCRKIFLRRCIKTISYQSSGMPNLTHLSSIKQGYWIWHGKWDHRSSLKSNKVSPWLIYKSGL